MGGATETRYELAHRQHLKAVCADVSKRLHHTTFEKHVLYMDMLDAFNKKKLWIVPATVSDAREVGERSGQL